MFPWIFRKYLLRFHMLTVKAFSETELFREWSTKTFAVCYFGNTLAMTMILFSKNLKFDIDSRNGTKNRRKVFRFLGKCNSIGSGKFSESWKGYLSSAVNVLTNTRKMSTKQGDTFCRSTSLGMMKKDHKSPLTVISQVFWTLSHVDCQSVFWKSAFYRAV